MVTYQDPWSRVRDVTGIPIENVSPTIIFDATLDGEQNIWLAFVSEARPSQPIIKGSNELAASEIPGSWEFDLNQSAISTKFYF